jgi:hypothetical protein
MTADHVQVTSLRIHISLRAPNKGVSATEVTLDQMRWDMIMRFTFPEYQIILNNLSYIGYYNL